MSFITDTSPTQKTIIAYGNPVLSMNNRKFGNKSLYCDGSSYISAQSGTDFVFGTQDFTVECWFNASSLPINNAERAILATADPSDFHGFLLELRNSNIRWLIGNGSSWVLDRIISGTTIVANRWYHIAITRSSGTARVFLNGELIDSASNNTNMPNINNSIRIGGRSVGNQYFIGYIDEVRVTKGIGAARYTTNFSPPLLPFASNGTPILPPDAPTNLQAIAGDQRITATWTEPLEDNGSDVIDYSVQYSDNGGSSWISLSKEASYETNIVLTGLVNDTSYDLRIGSVNIAGTGTYILQTGLVPFTEPLDTNPDPYFYDTSLLLHANGENDSTLFIDNSSYSRTVTANGNARISVLQAKFGGGSAYFDGSGDFLQTSSSVGALSDNFTVEAWVRLDAMPTSNAWPSQWNSTMVVVGRGSVNAGDGWGLIIGSSDLIFHSNDSSIFSGAHGMTTGQWYHVCACRSDGTIRLFVDGTQVTSGSFSDNVGTGAYCWIGCETGQGAYFNGYIDDLRITNNAARYTANFTPPTLAFSHVPPSPVVPSSPSNLSVFEGDQSVELSWSAATSDGYAPMSYDIEYSVDSANPEWQTATSSTALLLHFDTADISYKDRINDYSVYNRNILWNSDIGSGPASIITEYYDNNYGYTITPQKIGTGCLNIAATNSYSPSYVIKIDENNNLNPGTNDYTMEMWIYNQHVWNQYYSKNVGRLFGSYIAASGSYFGISHFGSYGYNMRIAKYVNGVDQGSSYYLDLPYADNNKWNHLAFSRQNGTLRIFVNGMKKVEVSDTTNDIFAAGGMVIGGGDSVTSNYMFGKLDEVRLTIGQAIYTDNFDFPPETALNNAVVYGLTNDIDYIFRMKTTNSAGSSPYTSNSTAITPSAPPIISISTQPLNTLTTGVSNPGTFSISASTNDGTPVTYQWYTYDEMYNGYETVGSWMAIDGANTSTLSRAFDYWNSDYIYYGYGSQPDLRVYGVITAGRSKKKTDIVRLWVEPTYWYPSSNLYPYFSTSGTETVNGVNYTVGSASGYVDYEIYSNYSGYNSFYTGWYTGNDTNISVEKSTDGITWAPHSTTGYRIFDNYYLYSSIDGSGFNSGDTIYFRVYATSIWPLTVSNNTGFSNSTPTVSNIANFKITWS